MKKNIFAYSVLFTILTTFSNTNAQASSSIAASSSQDTAGARSMELPRFANTWDDILVRLPHWPNNCPNIHRQGLWQDLVGAVDAMDRQISLENFRQLSSALKGLKEARLYTSIEKQPREIIVTNHFFNRARGSLWQFLGNRWEHCRITKEEWDDMEIQGSEAPLPSGFVRSEDVAEVNFGVGGSRVAGAARPASSATAGFSRIPETWEDPELR